MVVAQLVEQLLLAPEIRVSNSVIATIYVECLLSTVLKRRKYKKKRPRMTHLKSTLRL